MPDQAALDMGTNSRFQPALSATSDAPVLPSPAPAPSDAGDGSVANADKADVNSPAAAPALAGENTEASATSEEHDAGEGTAAKPKGGFQKRIDQLTKEREEARREREEYARRLDETLALLKERQPNERREARTEATDDPRPTRDSFDDPDSFSEALASWSSRQAIKTYETEQRQKADQERSNQEFQKVLTHWHESRAKAIEKHPDYEAVAMNPDIKVAEHVGMALLHVPNGHDVLYYLGQNPAEAARISALGAPHAAIEIGILSNKLATPPATSKAPAPTKPLIGGENAAAQVAPEDDPNYMERRLAEMRKRK